MPTKAEIYMESFTRPHYLGVLGLDLVNDGMMEHLPKVLDTINLYMGLHEISIHYSQMDLIIKWIKRDEDGRTQSQYFRFTVDVRSDPDGLKFFVGIFTAEEKRGPPVSIQGVEHIATIPVKIAPDWSKAIFDEDFDLELTRAIFRLG
jgi:hypothetical protein